MIKHMIARGIGFSPGGPLYIVTHGLASGAAIIASAIMTPIRSLWGAI